MSSLNQTIQDEYSYLNKIWKNGIAEAFIDFAKAENLSFWRESKE